MDNETISNVLNIIKKSNGNILFLISTDSYTNYVDAREVLKTSIRANNDKSVLTNSCETTKSDSDLLKDIQNDIDSNNDYFTRKILSIFTSSAPELARLKLMFESADQDIMIHVI